MPSIDWTLHVSKSESMSPFLCLAQKTNYLKRFQRRKASTSRKKLNIVRLLQNGYYEQVASLSREQAIGADDGKKPSSSRSAVVVDIGRVFTATGLHGDGSGGNSNGGVAELADAADLKSASFGIKGSSPFAPTRKPFERHFHLVLFPKPSERIIRACGARRPFPIHIASSKRTACRKTNERAKLGKLSVRRHPR